MRREWFGDNRDLVKWTCILREADAKHAVIYAAMLRPDNPPKKYVDSRVHAFFDSHKDLSHLAELFPGRFDLVQTEYNLAGASAYFSHLKERINIHRPSPVLIFLDPDTGIGPKNSDSKHVRMEDISYLCLDLRRGDKVVIYQHAWRDPAWPQKAAERLSDHLGEGYSVSEPFRPGNEDVCFLVVSSEADSSLCDSSLSRA